MQNLDNISSRFVITILLCRECLNKYYILDLLCKNRMTVIINSVDNP